MEKIKRDLLRFLDNNDLLRAALLVDKVRNPAYTMDYHVEQVMGLAAEIWNQCQGTKHDPMMKLQAINNVLFDDFGLEPKNPKYKRVIDDPCRYYLSDLLDNQTGSPLAVTILYKIIADQVGLECKVAAVGATHYLSIIDGDLLFYVEPFNRGRLLSQDEFQSKLKRVMNRTGYSGGSVFEIVDYDQLVAKLIQQLKHIYILKSKALEALRAVEVLTVLFPECPELSRDRGVLYCEMEYFSKAERDLQFYLQSCPDGEDVKEIRKLSSMLKGHKEVVN